MIKKIPIMNNLRLTYADIGARWGTKSTIVNLFNNTRVIAFEPEDSAYSDLENSNLKIGWKKIENTIIFNMALGSKQEQRNLYVTKKEEFSSLLKPSDFLTSGLLNIDDSLQIVKTIKINVDSLDNVVEENRLGIIDFMRINAQGYTDQILIGAKNVLANNVIGAHLEVEFVSVYDGQSTFDTTHKIMLENDFIFFDITSQARFFRNTIKQASGRGQLLWCDAVYLKNYRKIEDFESKLKLILIASEIGYNDYALEVLYFLKDSNQIDDVLYQVIEHAIKNKIKQEMNVFITTICRFGIGRIVIKYFLKFVEKFYNKMLISANPEYFFTRDLNSYVWMNKY